ncbi:MBL fold metallo-hydrolase [Bacillus alkalicellulosilyticus]|uniref:MBL fold metallo-hydrolase n=1 Tax=Alkalihalobacterium alkalicellulosilyticum TaxID=1912214 RepID=UPI000997EA5C|nr:MBL fold metallo-hydrolase [Bacillus alkalicellulosilyticus]
MKYILYWCVILLMFGCSVEAEQNVVAIATYTEPQEELIVHFIDVGQGDATLLQGPNFTILIDAGRHDQNDLLTYLEQAGVTSLDLIVGTHPHADHIGQMAQVLQQYDVKEVWLSGDEHTSRTFERVIDAIVDSGATYYEPRAFETFEIGSLKLEIVNPEKLTGDFHEGSISLRAIYGDISFLFTGDAEAQTEAEMISRGHELKSHVFQLGHHGSTTSNTERFLQEVQPEVGIISAGANNQYGHPHREVLDSFRERNIPLYGTIEYGTILVVTDGKSYEIETQRIEERKIENDENREHVMCIDINSASIQELEKIVHIGKERAEALVQHRPFKKVEELTKINGIGKGRLAEIVDEGLACIQN